MSCIESPVFDDELLVLIAKSFAESARHLEKHPTSGNWLTCESVGLFSQAQVTRFGCKP